MANFQGKWIDDLSVPKVNFETLMNKIGFSDKIDEYKNAISYFVFDIKGDTWTVKNGAEAFPGQEKVYTFKLGEKFQNELLDGSTFESTITSENDSQMTECMVNHKWGTFVIKRQLEGDIMKVEESVAGVTMTFQMKRVPLSSTAGVKTA